MGIAGARGGIDQGADRLALFPKPASPLEFFPCFLEFFLGSFGLADMPGEGKAWRHFQTGAKRQRAGLNKTFETCGIIEVAKDVLQSGKGVGQ